MMSIISPNIRRFNLHQQSFDVLVAMDGDESL